MQYDICKKSIGVVKKIKGLSLLLSKIIEGNYGNNPLDYYVDGLNDKTEYKLILKSTEKKLLSQYIMNIGR